LTNRRGGRGEAALKNDVAYVAIMVAFFAVAALLVIACDRIIGPDEEALAVGGEELQPAPDRVAA
jgi:hypothetical protein